MLTGGPKSATTGRPRKTGGPKVEGDRGTAAPGPPQQQGKDRGTTLRLLVPRRPAPPTLRQSPPVSPPPPQSPIPAETPLSAARPTPPARPQAPLSFAPPTLPPPHRRASARSRPCDGTYCRATGWAPRTETVATRTRGRGGDPSPGHERGGHARRGGSRARRRRPAACLIPLHHRDDAPGARLPGSGTAVRRTPTLRGRHPSPAALLKYLRHPPGTGT